MSYQWKREQQDNHETLGMGQNDLLFICIIIWKKSKNTKKIYNNNYSQLFIFPIHSVLRIRGCPQFWLHAGGAGFGCLWLEPADDGNLPLPPGGGSHRTQGPGWGDRKDVHQCRWAVNFKFIEEKSLQKKSKFIERK